MDKSREKNGTSVAASIRRTIGRQLLRAMLLCNLCALLLGAAAFAYCFESDYAGIRDPRAFVPQITRRVEYEKNGTLHYVMQMQGKPEKRIDITRGVDLSLLGVCAALLLELTALGIMELVNMGLIRKRLRPLSQLAEQAQRLSRVPLDTTRAPYDEPARRTGDAGAGTIAAEKFESLEHALEDFRPDAAHGRFSTGDDDLTGLEQAINHLIERMQESYRQQTRFVSDASHELRTPIAVIKGYADMLARWGKDDVQVLTESISAIQTETEHMSHLVEQLLFLARGDSGRTQLQFASVRLDELMRDIYEESCMIHPAHNWRLDAPQPVSVSADNAMLKQAIRILVDNAVKYTAEGESICLRALQNANGEACAQVQDSGMGISQEELPHVFERFFRADPARNGQKGGTGLGLSIAKWIVDRHGGYFDVVSLPDVGTRIGICLPPERKQRKDPA